MQIWHDFRLELFLTIRSGIKWWGVEDSVGRERMNSSAGRIVGVGEDKGEKSQHMLAA